MTIRELIAAKRDRHRHSKAELNWLCKAAASGEVPNYQLSAWLMAAYLNGLDSEETTFLTLGMAESGERLDLSDLPKPWVDKHSTGGVGDKTTIALLPVLAAGGLTVVKMSGRGLGITGGTVDKLASIPGFRLDLTPREMADQARRIGLALTGQTADLAPADKTFYALRDATETVASIPLIVSSILSKKLAGGAEILGLDVKCGSGAFMKTAAEAQELARWLLDIGTRCGLSVHISITDMDQPLGRAAGNALEVKEAFETLMPGALPTRFTHLVLHLAAETFVATGKADSLPCGVKLARETIDTGRAQERAMQWIQAQGGDASVVTHPESLELAPVRQTVVAKDEGWIERVDAGRVGQVVLELGGGRQKASDTIDPAVGVETLKSIGERIAMGEPLFSVYARNPNLMNGAVNALASAVTISPRSVAPNPLILGTLT